MVTEIEFWDGNTQTLVARVPFDQVPPPNRELYFAGGRPVGVPEQADEIVRIAKVVRTSYDDAGQLTTAEHAARVIMQEYDEQGRLVRETSMKPR